MKSENGLVFKLLKNFQMILHTERQLCEHGCHWMSSICGGYLQDSPHREAVMCAQMSWDVLCMWWVSGGFSTQRGSYVSMAVMWSPLYVVGISGIIHTERQLCEHVCHGMSSVCGGYLEASPHKRGSYVSMAVMWCPLYALGILQMWVSEASQLWASIMWAWLSLAVLYMWWVSWGFSTQIGSYVSMAVIGCPLYVVGVLRILHTRRQLDEHGCHWLSSICGGCLEDSPHREAVMWAWLSWDVFCMS